MNTFALNYELLVTVLKQICVYKLHYWVGGRSVCKFAILTYTHSVFIFKYSQKLFHVNVLLKFVKSEMFSILSSIINYRSIRR